MDKYLIFSDLHIHNHKKDKDRLEDCLKVLEWIFTVATQQQVHSIIFLGDLFHDRSKIDVYIYQRTFEALSKSPVDFYILLGNHDLWHKDKWDISSCKPLAALDKVHVIGRPTTMTIGDTKFDFLPFTEDPVSALESLQESSAEILLAHLAIHGATLNRFHSIYSDVIIEHDGEMVIVDNTLFKHWKKVYLGHYHGEQTIGNIEYIGSPLQLSFGESFQKKHIILLDEKVEYIENDFSPKHFILEIDDLDKYDLKGHFVRIFVEDISSVDLLELRQEIIQRYSPALLEIKQKKKQDDKNVIDDAKAILYKDDEMLERYIEQTKPDLDCELLLKIGKEICEANNE